MFDVHRRILMPVHGTENLNTYFNMHLENGTSAIDFRTVMGIAAAQALHPSFYFFSYGIYSSILSDKIQVTFKYGTISNFLSVFCEILNYFLASRMYLIKSSTVAPTPG